ncbi:hypothetical protein B0H19DRAFT_1272605 [Mycena capillaripes]|nr:hypothetical protein B0H19DRAFT_1272605 [Mycena capillaripes]
MSGALDDDVFSHILSHIPEFKSVYAVLRALPKRHPWFLVALHRLCELPVYLDTYNPSAAAASNQILNYLLDPEIDLNSLEIARSIRHLVIAVEHNKYYWPPTPVVENEQEEEEEEEEEEIVNEEVSGIINPEEPEQLESEEDVDVVAFWERLPGLFEKTRNLRSLDYRNYRGLPLSRENAELLAACEKLQTLAVDSAIRETSWRHPRAFEDPEAWDIEPFLSTLIPSITSLDLRHISQTMLLTIMDITEGVWDWNMMGSPQRGATGDYKFPSLGIPALRHFELVVADLTLSNPRAGPLDLVNCALLSELSLDIRPWLVVINESALLPGMGPGDAEIFCSARNLWSSDSTHFGGIEKVSWRAALQAALSQLESLRVGFGVVDAQEAWPQYGRYDPISPELLAHLARFPQLTDVHILFPRPETQVSGAPNPVVDPRTVNDVASIFRSNSTICRIGIGNSVVWERCGEPPGILLVSDGSSVPNPAVPRFYHAGHMAKYDPADEIPWAQGDNTTPLRPRRGEEIGQLRDLLKRILQ